MGLQNFQGPQGRVVSLCQWAIEARFLTELLLVVVAPKADLGMYLLVEAEIKKVTSNFSFQN